MLPRFLLLLSLLGPRDSLQSWDIQEHGTKVASGPVPLRERRQATGDDDLGEYYYFLEGTEPPEMLINVTSAVAANPESPTVLATLEQRVSVGAGISESTTAKVTATGPAGPDAGGLAVEIVSTESATEWRPSTVEMTIQPAATEAETSQPAPTEAETSQPAPTEAETSQPAPTEAETSQPAPTEAGTSKPAPTEAETLQPAPTEAGTSQPAPTEAETSQLPRSQVVKSLFTEATATEAPSTEPTATEIMPTESTATENMSTDSTIFLGSSVTHKDNDVATGHLNDNGLKNGLFVTPRSSLATTTPGISDLIPVKQCLLVILILASLATVFLVCTVVLAVRLSRKNHMYPVRNYSPTEMICISSLLPEGGEGAPVTANGDLPKVQDPKTEPSEDRDGDDLTLRSFLP
ncbi:P-selectin glycoprotein ligand 1 [Microtus ochrogaster]|uniref:P-selectin glycoprotein ligand 1 n=1 Tax=Microtus ochrogaster TaxID=79684 RepID=A0ABM1URD6_MICOH|nr:P-selectin glycoprotein ligand 1 [Microtus ochrogaster]XP_026644548.1 P-selectin glycoprotein ligand 1 [Microtus ochrogaster]